MSVFKTKVIIDNTGEVIFESLFKELIPVASSLIQKEEKDNVNNEQDEMSKLR